MSDPRDQQDLPPELHETAERVEIALAQAERLPLLDTPIDDCWNRIGVRGDGSPESEELKD